MRTWAQSSLEYLTTYAWAILVIAVVVGVLYQLGLFSTNTFAPRAQPGSCQVFRPNGPGSIQLISLTGTCSGLLPQYVSTYSPISEILTPANVPTPITISAWFKIHGTGTNNPNIIFSTGGGLNIVANTIALNVFLASQTCGTLGWYTVYTPVVDTWYNVLLEYSNAVGGYLNVSLNGNSLYSSNSLGCFATTSIKVGTVNIGYGYAGYISNVQLYNTSFTQNEIKTLYIGGVGGSPTILQNLIAWWPLNGDAKDYGGNGYAGTTANDLSFTATWTGGYTPP